VIAYLSSDMRGVVANMIEMYERFGDMSQDVAVITNSVTAIDNNMVGMPAIATRMNHMNQAVSGMRDHVGTMTQNIEQIDTGMVAISQGVADMALRFDHLTLTVHRMNYNVHQMSGPLRAFPGAP
jgi:methyl-accepting chemotaxis protein